VSWREDDVVRTVETHEPTRIVSDLSERLGGEIPGLAIARPSPEDLYLSLIGHDTKDI
jgi:ABC-2 type transport system ATP-binding protein